MGKAEWKRFHLGRRAPGDPVASLFLVRLPELLLVAWLFVMLAAMAMAVATFLDEPLPPLPLRGGALSPDGRLAVLLGEEETALLDLSSGRMRATIPVGATAFAFHPDGKLLAISGGKVAVSLWELETGTRVKPIEIKGARLSEFISFSREGDLLVVGDRRGPVQVLHLPSGNWEYLWNVQDDSGFFGVTGPVAFLPTEKRVPMPPLVLGERHGRAVIVGGLWFRELGGWMAEIDNARRLECPEGFHLLDMAVAPDGETLAVASASLDSGQVVLWNATTGEEIRRLPTLASDGLTFSGDGSWLAVARGRTAEIWDGEQGILRCRTPDSAHDIVAIGFQDDDRYLVAVDSRGVVSTHDATTGDLIRQIKRERPVPFWALGLVGIWLVLWLAADMQRRRTWSPPVGALDLGVYLLPAMGIVYVYAALMLANTRYEALDGVVAEVMPFRLNVVGEIAFWVALVCLAGGMTRRFRSRLIFTAPSLAIGLALKLCDRFYAWMPW